MENPLSKDGGFFVLWVCQFIACLPAKSEHTPLQKEEKKMFDRSGQWIHLETYDDFDNGLSDLIELWSSASKTVTKTVKESALVHFKEDLEAAALQWVDNRAKSKKYASIASELAEFEDVLKNDWVDTAGSDSKASAAPAKTKKKD